MSESAMTTVIWIAVVVVVAGGYFLYQYLKKRKSPAAGRDKGAGKAVSVMHAFARANGFRFFGPGTYQSAKGGTGRLDAVVAGYFGILGVKALGYNGEIYGAAGEEEWLQVAPDGARQKFANPVSEASADMRVLRDVLFAAKMRQVPVEIVCVFTSKKAQLALPKNTGHYTMKEFKSLLQKDKYLADKGIDLDKLAGVLQTAQKPPETL